MPDRRMFWRIIWRLVAANRGRLFVILLALAAGAAVTSALLNLQLDAKRRLTTEFRVLGANVVIAPRGTAEFSPNPTTLEEAVLEDLPPVTARQQVSAISSLYLIAEVSVPGSDKTTQAVVAGNHLKSFAIPENLGSSPQISHPESNALQCDVGVKVSEQLHLHPGDRLALRDAGREESCTLAKIVSLGGPEDNQISLDLSAAQRLANLPGRISFVRLSVAGTPREINRYIAALAQHIPNADVHGVRQYTEAETKIYNRISGLLTATVVLVLLLTGLCVMAAMTNVAMDRKNDVGLMKAIGGTTRRVLRLFLAEAALLGLTAGLVGSALGIFISMALGKAVFGVAARPRLIVYPVSVALTIIVAIIGSYPLRRLTSISPASIFRGLA